MKPTDSKQCPSSFITGDDLKNNFQELLEQQRELGSNYDSPSERTMLDVLHMGSTVKTN